ncbi:hypothetical protein ACX8Z9_12030 [Arthrobacter halodurans]|uniref:Uncharacterized protein n=1 Tax=Arthrobacter halodurans TaxID=516699 RepID=A0ABV4US65_9MICC
MKKILATLAACALALATATAAEAAPRQTMTTTYVTGYSMQDNDPAGSRAIAYSQLWGFKTRHQQAGGDGTYANPITLAVSPGRYAPGTRIYMPHVDRFFVVEDSCASCGAKSSWVDMYVGGTMSDPTSKVDACMAQLTGNYRMVVNPTRYHKVVKGPLYNSRTDTCAKVTVRG